MWSVLVCLSSGEAWKLLSRASVKGLLLCSGTFVHGSISEDRGLDSSPASPHGNPVEDIERAVASEAKEYNFLSCLRHKSRSAS